MRALLFSLLLLVTPTRDRRVVDVVHAGDPHSEAYHGFVGHESTVLTHGGTPVRRATGWMRYGLNVFDDSEVTVLLVFAGGDSVARAYDVVVEDSLVAVRTLEPGATAIVEVDVPFALTKGKPSIAVVVRARGGTTPALRELRTVQDHNEL